MTANITIPAPHVPYGPQGVPEPEADADYLREAARNIEHARCMGSNLTATVVKLLNDAADALLKHPTTRHQCTDRYCAARDDHGGIRLNGGNALLVAAADNTRADVLDWFIRSKPSEWREQYRAALTLMNREQGYTILPTIHPDEQMGHSVGPTTQGDTP